MLKEEVPQSIRPIEEAPVGEAVLGVWVTDDPVIHYIFESIIVENSDGFWYSIAYPEDEGLDRDPDGWLPLPIVEIKP